MATDRLNNLKTSKTISIRKYFGEMDLGEYSKQRRISMATQMEEFLIVMLTLMKSDVENGREIDKDYYSGYLRRRYEDAVRESGEIDTDKYTDVQNRISDISPKLIDSTIRNKDKDYFFSKDRATDIAEEEINTIVNIVEFKDAVDGGKHYKTWHTMRDSKVRQAHYEAEGQKVKIDDYFEVMGEHLRFPRDVENGSPDNIDGCRCTVTYS